MQYYSGTGDRGDTTIAGGKVPKNSSVIKALGDIDELSAFLGNSTSKLKYGSAKTAINEVQRALYRISGELSGYSELKKNDGAKKIDENDVKSLEDKIKTFSEGLPDLTKFIYPNGTDAATSVNICRAVARRAERSVVETGVASEPMLKYINRLSSFLFVLFRHLNRMDNSKEETF